MPRVVYDTTPACKSLGGIFYHATLEGSARQWRMAAKPIHRPTFIRQWRQHRGYSLDKLADMVPMDKSNLSKVERGILPYNQEMLERVADALMTDVASLLMRDPTAPGAIWARWERASMGERQQIEAVAQALISSRKTA